MAEKPEVSSPEEQFKSKEDNFDAEFEEFTQKVLKNPTVVNSFPSDPLENLPPTPVQKRSSIFFKKKSTKDDRHENNLYEEVKNEKKVILLKYRKNYQHWLNFFIETIALHLLGIQKAERTILYSCLLYVSMVITQQCFMNLKKNHHICPI